jgi:hypothetical protein
MRVTVRPVLPAYATRRFSPSDSEAFAPAGHRDPPHGRFADNALYNWRQPFGIWPLKALEAKGRIKRDKRRVTFPDWQALRDVGDINQRYLTTWFSWRPRVDITELI